MLTCLPAILCSLPDKNVSQPAAPDTLLALEARLTAALAQPEAGAPPLAGLGSTLRALLVPDQGTAALHNNRGAVRLLLGKLSEAEADFDRAATLRPQWAPPWTNAALLWLEKKNAEKALDCALQARGFGGEDPWTLTNLAEAAVRRRQWDVARETLQRVMELNSRFPYALQVRAQLEESQSRSRDAERFRMQALALLAQTATEGRYQPWRQESQLSLGTGERSRVSTGAQQVQGGRFSLGEVRLDRQAVEGRSEALQTQLRLLGLTGRGVGEQNEGLFVRLTQTAGERPGARGGSAGTTDTEQHATVAHLQRRASPQQQTLRSLVLRGDRASSLNSHELGGEVRWDQRRRSAGLALLEVRRTGHLTVGASGFPAPSEPHDQLLGAGTTRLATGYALVQGTERKEHGWQLGSVFGWQQSALASLPTRSYGGLLPQRGQQSFALLPAGFAHWQLTGARHLRVAMVPRLGQATGDFLPGSLLPGPVFLVPGATDDPSTTLSFPDVFLPGPDGRRWDLTTTVTETQRQQVLQVEAFHRRLANGVELTADPRLTRALALRSLSRAELTGVRLSALRTRWEGSMVVQRGRAIAVPPLALRLRHDTPLALPESHGYVQLDHWRRTESGYVPGGGSSEKATALTLVELGAHQNQATGWERFVRLRLPLGATQGYFSGYPLSSQLVVGTRRHW